MIKLLKVAILSNETNIGDLLRQHQVIDELALVDVKSIEAIHHEPFDGMIVADNDLDSTMLNGVPTLFLDHTGALQDGHHLLAKPFHISKLFDFIKRLQVNISHKHGVTLFNTTLDISAYQLFDNAGNHVSLTENETSLLRYLFEAYPEDITKKQLLKDVWGYDENIDTSTLQTHIYRLRQKMSEFNVAIETTSDGYKVTKLKSE